MLPKTNAKSGKVTTSTIPLLANALTARALDRTITDSMNLNGLKQFAQPARPSRPLQSGEARHMVAADQHPLALCEEEQLYRSCIKNADGDRCLEVANVDDEYELHTMSDCGSVGFTQSLWNHTAGLCHGNHSSDVHAHDSNNSVKKALVATCLWLLVLEWGLVANFRKAPFESWGNFGKFKKCASGLFVFIRQSLFTDELWLAFYEDIAMGLDMWGTPMLATA